jgi:hypothetical protein
MEQIPTFGQKPVYDQTTFNASLRMENKNHLFDPFIIKGFLNGVVCFPNIISGILEISLDL